MAKFAAKYPSPLETCSYCRGKPPTPVSKLGMQNTRPPPALKRVSFFFEMRTWKISQVVLMLMMTYGAVLWRKKILQKKAQGVDDFNCG